MDSLAADLPRYRVNILAKIADVPGAGSSPASHRARLR
jgi:hypothetical protein